MFCSTAALLHHRCKDMAPPPVCQYLLFHDRMALFLQTDNCVCVWAYSYIRGSFNKYHKMTDLYCGAAVGCETPKSHFGLLTRPGPGIPNSKMSQGLLCHSSSSVPPPLSRSLGSPADIQRIVLLSFNLPTALPRSTMRRPEGGRGVEAGAAAPARSAESR